MNRSPWPQRAAEFLLRRACRRQFRFGTGHRLGENNERQRDGVDGDGNRHPRGAAARSGIRSGVDVSRYG